MAARLGRGIASAVSAAYHAIDPATRRHLAQMPVLGLTLIARPRVRIDVLPSDGRRPILFVHGLGGHRGNFALLRAWLHLFGRTRTYALGFERGSLIDDMAAQLRVAIAETLAVNGLTADEGVDLVCHSMGGIVARLALEDADTARSVATVVTLGSPHAGTLAARFAATYHTLALRPGSPLMRRLEAQLPWRASQPKMVCLWSSDDVFMLPAETATLDGAHNRHVAGITHLSFLLNPVAFQAVFTALEPGLPELSAAHR